MADTNTKSKNTTPAPKTYQERIEEKLARINKIASENPNESVLVVAKSEDVRSIAHDLGELDIGITDMKLSIGSSRSKASIEDIIATIDEITFLSNAIRSIKTRLARMGFGSRYAVKAARAETNTPETYAKRIAAIAKESEAHALDANAAVGQFEKIATKADEEYAKALKALIAKHEARETALVAAQKALTAAIVEAEKAVAAERKAETRRQKQEAHEQRMAEQKAKKEQRHAEEAESAEASKETEATEATEAA